MPELKEVFEMITKQTEPDLDSWKEQERRQRRTARNRRVGAFALVAAIGIVAGVIAINAIDTENRERTGGLPTRVPEASTHVFFDLSTGETRPLPSSLEGGGTFAVSPDGDQMAFAPWPDPIGDDRNLSVYIAGVDGSAARRVRPDPFGIDEINPRWSPDGTIVFQGRNARTEELGNLYLLDPVSGTTTKLTDLPFGVSHHWFMSPSFHHDGRVILFNLPRGGNDEASMDEQTWDLWTVPATGGEPTLVRRNAAHGSYSPTDGTIAYLRGPRIKGGSFGAESIWLADADGSDPRLLVHGTDLVWPRWSPDGTRIAYSDAGGVTVIDVATGDTSRVIDGGSPEWVDDHTLIVERG